MTNAMMCKRKHYEKKKKKKTEPESNLEEASKQRSQNVGAPDSTVVMATVYPAIADHNGEREAKKRRRFRKA